MRYANHECAGCGLILPAYELERVEDTVETGTSRTERRIGHTPQFRHTSTTKHYSKRGKLLCGPCRTKRIIGKLVTGACGIGLLLTFMPRGGGNQTSPTASIVEPSALFSSSDVGTAAGTEAPSEADDGRDADTARPLTENDDEKPQDLADRKPTPTRQRSSDPPQANGPEKTSDLAEQISTRPASVDNVHEAMLEALKTGEATRWHKGRLDGYAVPSTAASDGCRMVIVSIDGGASSAAERLCPAGDSAL